jgi:hypothetical protein
MRKMPWLLWISAVFFVCLGVLVTRKIAVSINNPADFNPEKQEEKN